MKPLDRALQRWRAGKAGRWIPASARVLDIGCGDGALFRQLGGQVGGGVGIDPSLRAGSRFANFLLAPGRFPKDMPTAEPFDAITMLAVLEHFPQASHAELRAGCARYLKPGGTLILTVPSAVVDVILKLLRGLRLIEGMALEEHHSFEVGQTLEVFPPPDFQLVRRERFQLGLNHLFVFRRAPADGRPEPRGPSSPGGLPGRAAPAA